MSNPTVQQIIDKALEVYDELVPGSIHEAPRTYEEACSGKFNKLASALIIELHDGLEGEASERLAHEGARLMYRLADDLTEIAKFLESGRGAIAPPPYRYA